MKITAKKSLNVRHMALWMLLMMLPFMNSCKQEATDASDLLATVPSSAGMVVGVNLKSLLEKTGCEVNGTEIVAGKEMKELLATIQKDSVNRKNADALNLFLSGDSGIDPSGAIVFTDAYGTYVTAMLADTQKFYDFVEKQTGDKFTEENGVKVCREIAVLGAQVWVSISGSSIDSKAVKNYAALEKGQSFVSNPFADKVSNIANDIVGWSRINTFFQQKGGISTSDIAAFNMMLGMTCEGATSISFTLDFLKGEVKALCNVLNDEGKPAKYLFPFDKVDTSLVKSLGENANAVFSFVITKEAVKKMEQLNSSFGGPYGEVIEYFKALDGTIAVAFSDITDPLKGIRGVITTNGDASSGLMNLVSQLCPAKKDGKLIRLENGTLEGSLKMADVADFLKGSGGGGVMNLSVFGADASKIGVSSFGVAGRPNGAGISAEFVVKSTDPSENFLITVMKNIK